jgi:hypothetical protein
MAAAIMILLLGGWLVAFIGGILFVIAAFRTSIPWGLAVLFIPFAGLVFLFKYWPMAKRPFSIQLLGLALMLVGMLGGLRQGAAMGADDPLMGALMRMARQQAEGPSETIRFETISPLQAAAPDEEPGPILDVTGDTGTEALTADNPRALVGRSLDEVRALLGRPRGEMRRGRDICYLYAGFTLFSRDGRRVTDVEFTEADTLP